MKYLCNVCNTFQYESAVGNKDLELAPGKQPENFPDTYKCPICQADKTHLILQE